MPALSQSLVFVPSTAVGNTGTTSVVYPNTATGVLTYVSDKLKGDGYFGSSDGLHTAMYVATQDFVGTVTMQATLASEPTSLDWFTVNDTSASYAVTNIRNTSTVDIKNFTGNFVWVRGHVMISDGSVEYIQYNH